MNPQSSELDRAIPLACIEDLDGDSHVLALDHQVILNGLPDHEEGARSIVILVIIDYILSPKRCSQTENQQPQQSSTQK